MRIHEKRQCHNLQTQVEAIKDDTDILLDTVTGYLDNLSEHAYNSERGERLTHEVELLEAIQSNLDEVIEALAELSQN